MDGTPFLVVLAVVVLDVWVVMGFLDAVVLVGWEGVGVAGGYLVVGVACVIAAG